VILLPAAAGLAALMLAGWVASLLTRDVSLVDVLWGLAFVLVAAIGLAAGDGDHARRLLLLVLVGLWGLRLAGYIAWRKLRHPGEDKRYAAMREKRGPSFRFTSLVSIFALQGMMAWVISLPLQGAAHADTGLGPLDWIGAAVWAVGLTFEAVGDAQLSAFKRHNTGKVMDRGLWRYTRHPNYFGDATVWWGLYLIALSAGAWWTIVGPLVMTFLLVRVSGKDLTEKAMHGRPGYAEYVQRTSGFVPLPPRGASR
jgi:steroid 5-alpha reductase family enzyme